MIRLQQMKWAARAVRIVCRFSMGQKLMRTLQTTPVASSIYRATLGHHRPFASLREANSAVAEYASDGHENPYNAQLHLELGKSARPSDYAALFYVRKILPHITTIFDLGGNVGNLFYCYSKHLDGLPGVSWEVLDMPANIRFGEQLAKQRGAHQLKFTTEWLNASNADLLIISGSLHYFEKTVPHMVSELPEKPKYILINRTPLTEASSVAMIQDAGEFRVACMLHNRLELIQQFIHLGYTVVDQWAAPELSLDIPGYPEYKISAYSGIFLFR
jgi:putative methyltransferase (TIGR04325 family)